MTVFSVSQEKGNCKINSFCMYLVSFLLRRNLLRDYKRRFNLLEFTTIKPFLHTNSSEEQFCV